MPGLLRGELPGCSALQKQQHNGGQPCRNSNMTVVSPADTTTQRRSALQEQNTSVVSPAETTTQRWSTQQKQQHNSGQPCRNTTVVSPAAITTQWWSALQKQQHSGGQPGTSIISLLGSTSSPATCTTLPQQTAGNSTGKTVIRLSSVCLKTARSGSICWTPRSAHAY